jgi:SOUL heme-binding protein
VSMNQKRAADVRMDAAVNEPAKGGVKAFGALAGYLFGKNVEKTAMKMTTPVLTTEDKRMSFVLPSAYWKEGAAAIPPKPLQGSGVLVERVAGGERAVLMFGGYAVNVDTRKQELLDRTRRDAEWEVVPGEHPVLAQYNDPFTPPWKRLNEVSIAIRPRSPSVP